MKKGNILIAAGLLLIAAALSLTGYNLWESNRAGAAAAQVLEKLLPLVNDDPIPKEGRIAGRKTEPGKTPVESSLGEYEYPDYILNPDMEMPENTIDGIDYIGYLSVPTIERVLPIGSEWSYPNLRITPCRYSGSAYRNNLVICGHNSRHFGTLKNLSYGDTVTFTDMDGNVFRYRVIEITSMRPTAVEEMVTGDWDLTLFTCTLGAAMRLAIRCEAVEN